MLIGLNKDESCTVKINHKDPLNTHSIVISNFDDEKLHVRQFNSTISSNKDYEKCKDLLKECFETIGRSELCKKPIYEKLLKYFS